jgi:hypothetical protein
MIFIHPSGQIVKTFCMESTHHSQKIEDIIQIRENSGDKKTGHNWEKENIMVFHSLH